MMLTLGKWSYTITEDFISNASQRNINTMYFSKINHKVKFELDEEGVEGAAAANIEISFRNLAR